MNTFARTVSTYFLIFFCAAFFLTICRRFIAVSWESWLVGSLTPGAALEPFPLFPFPPPLPPVLAWDAPGDPAPDGAFPWLSPLDERFIGCLPRVRGGGGLSGTWLDPFPLPPPGTLAPPRLDLVPDSPDSPTGFCPGGLVRVLLLLELEELSLELVGRAELVLAPNAAQPVRPLPEEEALLLVGFAEVVDALTSVRLNA